MTPPSHRTLPMSARPAAARPKRPVDIRPPMRTIAAATSLIVNERGVGYRFVAARVMGREACCGHRSADKDDHRR